MNAKSGVRGFTLPEVVISLAISVIAFSGIIYAYINTAERAEWSAYSLAAQSLAMQRIEQARAAKWDPLGYPAVDDLIAANFTNEINILDIPISKKNIVYATNITAITVISTNPPLKMIRSDCVWNFMGRRNFTNTVITYRGPDQ